MEYEQALIISKRRRADAAMTLRLAASSSLVESALALALRTRHTVNDCLYLALAVRTKAVL